MFNDFKEMVGKLSHASGNLEYVSSLYTHSFMFVGCEGKTMCARVHDFFIFLFFFFLFAFLRTFIEFA